jgi:hypothetical protein
MANTGNSTADGGKPIVPFSTSVLDQITSFAGLIDSAASAAGVSALTIAAPMAREINKVEAGDYNPYGASNLIAVVAPFGGEAEMRAQLSIE